ncbi:MAG: DegT/DnrJ/EryC1/StrS family aminotransferase [Phycisphaeraceae bacterium]|nr:DegT/DnrJ/EryC1/StrS family aminotransferase [Phycisphaeraceae bacterium]
MPVPALDLTRHHGPLFDQFRAAFDQVLRTGQFVLGPAVERFEKRLAERCGVGHAVGLSSGTDALLVAMMALGIGPGDEVIVPTFTFFATAGCVSRTGATPVFADILPDSFNLDPASVSAKITPCTKAVIPVHLYGQTADMDTLNALAKKHNLFVIEDAAQAIAAADKGRPVGTLGHVACLSFYPTKNLSAFGDAGACVTADADLAQKMRQVRNHGQTGEYEHQMVGGNFRLDGVQGAILDVKLDHLTAWTDARRAHAKRYRELMSGIDGLALPAEGPDKFHVYNQYTVRVTPKPGQAPSARRDGLLKHLRSKQIGCRVYYPLCLHLQPCFAGLGGKQGDCPVGERLSQEVLSIPMFPEMTDAEQQEVAAAVREFMLA